MSGVIARRVTSRTPTTLLVLGLTLAALGRLVGALWRRPGLLVVLAWLGVAAWLVGRYGGEAVAAVAGGFVVLVAVILAAWSWLAPSSFEQRLAGPVRSSWRTRRYRAMWSDAMYGCGLVRAEVEPVLMMGRSTGGVDRLTVHLAPGQLVTDWRDVAPRLAAAFGATSVRVRSSGPRDVLLLVRYRDERASAPPGRTIAAPPRHLDPEPERELEAVEPAAPPAGAFPRRRPAKT